MAVYALPLRSDLPRFDFTVDLDGVSYKFLFYWSTRESCWYMSLLLENETPIWHGVRVVVGFPLQKRSKNPNAPPGLLIAVDSNDKNTDPGLHDLGNRVRLLYFDREDMRAMRARLLSGNP